ncbi:MAG: coenzyme F390 synthetase [Methanospirillaceae archaeon]|nr:coenzyme F390 synthetase [Methanospirillaceae archaeon]
MKSKHIYNEPIETMDRDALDSLIAERVRYTVQYAHDHSAFYRQWFAEHRIDPKSIQSHEDLLTLPIISGADIRAHQPPFMNDFGFRSVPWEDVFTIHETSGTSGIPKSFFLTWEEWERLAEKYARIFVSQGFGKGDRIVICASYGMNVGANTMTLAARDLGITIIPTGKCTFPPRTIASYHPTGIVGSVFKLLRLARQMKAENLKPEESGLKTLVVGGEAFADESRAYLAELWDCDVYNAYGSTEGTMCGECTALSGLHVPEDLVHMDLYDPGLKDFVPEGECGRIVLTTLLPVGAKCGMLLINYDTEDTSVVLSRDPCECGRTHMRIYNPQREAETFWVHGTPMNRVDVERGVFQRENMEYLTGEYEAFLYPAKKEDETIMKVFMEGKFHTSRDSELISENFQKSFLTSKPGLRHQYDEGLFSIEVVVTPPEGLELSSAKGRSKRLQDRR